MSLRLSARVPPSLVSALIEDLSSPPSAGHTCYVRPDPLSAGPLPSTSQSRKKRVARPFTRLSLCCLSSHFYRHKWPFLN